MKLLRSTFLAFYLTTTTTSNVSAFTPQISKSSSLAATTRHHNHNHPCSANKLSQSSSTSLSAFLHEQPASQISDEEIQKERQFLQVVREVNMAKEYMDWLIEESGDGGGGAAAAAAEESTEESTPVAAETSAANDIELFGGGGDANPSSTTEEKQTVYQPSLRSDLGSTILLSGTVDATLLSILNNNFFGQDNVPNFNFSTIKALVKDVALTKKRAISREARYGGLLDKLVIQEATNDSSSVLPTPEELGGVTSWIVQLSLGDDTSDNLTQIAKLAQGSNELTNVVVLVDGMASTKNIVEGWETVMDVSDHGSAFKCTLLAIGELHDGGNDGGYYHVGALEGGGGGTASPDTIDAPKLSKKKAYQLVAHALALDSTANASLMAYEYPTVALQAVVSPYAEDDYAIRDEEGNEKVDEYKDIKMEGRMIQAMRELGFTQYSELDVLVGKGIESYKEYSENPPNRKNAFTPVSKLARDEADEKIMAQLEKEGAERQAKQDVIDAEKKKTDIEGIAKEWVTREYTLRMLNGDIDDTVSEKDFMLSVWDEALIEGAKAYEYIRSDEYIRQRERQSKTASVEDKLFWDGMPDDMRLMREKMIEKVKKQYMDLLSEEELEKIILSET